MSKHSILFVGSFKKEGKDGSIGGTMVACRSLVESKLSQYVHWHLIDSTSDTVPAPVMYKRLFKAISRIYRFIYLINNKKIRIALVFCSSGFSFVEKGIMILIVKLSGKKTIFSPRSGLIINDIENSSFMKWFVAVVIRSSDLVICQSNSWKNIYQSISGEDDSKFQVISNWINSKEYTSPSPPASRNAGPMSTGHRPPQRGDFTTPIAKGKSEGKAPASGGLGGANILYLGWIEIYKGIYDLIKAVELNKSDFKNCLFHICGMGSQINSAKKLVNELGLDKRIIFKGWVGPEKKLAMLKSSDILVLPSHREGLPNALLEAMAVGLPVIASKVGAIPEVIKHGENGLLFDAKDHKTLSRLLISLIVDRNKRKVLGQKAREHILKHHDIEKVWKIFLELFDKLDP
ncbi:MAG: glycosyltransferase family 4 protein [Cytophagales bacterium]|nr:glycosyltransferase family 4 protein [Cytophagales bacterium]